MANAVMTKNVRIADDYGTIVDKMNSLRAAYPSLRSKPDSYVFSVLCIRSNFYKNPALIFNQSDWEEMVLDGPYDGGVDILLNDPNEEGSDLIIAQSKFEKTITAEEISEALNKMATFYNNMLNGRYERIKLDVQSRFLTLNAEVGDESKIHFVFYTSAPRNRIRQEKLIKDFNNRFSDSNKFEVTILFADDIIEEIKQSESRRQKVEYGKLSIDKSGNCLYFDDENAAIVNISALSLKKLYGEHNIKLLALNLRYHVKGRDVDWGIRDTIENAPDWFWYRNNGITIICDDFSIDGKELKLYNFSIINGGQTTYMIHKSNIDGAYDFYLPCKVIKAIGDNEEQKNVFSLSISKAANSQKAIKAIDLKANSPEQLRFAQAMREVGVYYQTKRGEAVPKEYLEYYKNTSLTEVGKLCLAGVFQVPCLSRQSPKSLYEEKYYGPIFNGDMKDQKRIAMLCKELLYIDYFFRKKFLNKFKAEIKGKANAEENTSVASNARTICIAFVALAARYMQQNITDEGLDSVFHSKSDSSIEKAYDVFSDLGNIKCLLPSRFFENKDQYDKLLADLFTAIIGETTSVFLTELDNDQSLTATNYLKKDKNYYRTLRTQWGHLEKVIRDTFSKYDVSYEK